MHNLAGFLWNRVPILHKDTETFVFPVIDAMHVTDNGFYTLQIRNNDGFPTLCPFAMRRPVFYSRCERYIRMILSGMKNKKVNLDKDISFFVPRYTTQKCDQPDVVVDDIIQAFEITAPNELMIHFGKHECREACDQDNNNQLGRLCGLEKKGNITKSKNASDDKG